jgi:hypothetical protein
LKENKVKKDLLHTRAPTTGNCHSFVGTDKYFQIIFVGPEINEYKLIFVGNKIDEYKLIFIYFDRGTDEYMGVQA